MIYKTASILFISALLCGCWTVKEGSQTGIVTGSVTNGIIFKTSYAYIQTGENAITSTKYCVTDKATFLQLAEAEKNKKSITVKYHKELFIAFWRCNDSNYIIDEVTK